MYYIVNREGRIVGTASGPLNVQDLASRGQILLESELNLPLGEAAVSGFPHQPKIVPSEVPALRSIELAAAADDSDADGIPDLVADGVSTTTVTATLRDSSSQLMKEEVDVTFRTTAGALSHRTAIARNGRAEVTLTSSRETVQAVVSATAEGFQAASLVVEFIPRHA